MKAGLKAVAAFLVILMVMAIPMAAAEPYSNYTYSGDKEKLKEPQAVYACGTLTGTDLGVGAFNTPSDLYIRDDTLYIADTGNNRIVVSRIDGTAAYAIAQFEHDGAVDTFHSPSGVFVTDTGLLYICDRDNGRIVVLQEDGSFVAAYGRPDTKLLSEDIVYKPVRVSVDSAGRMFVVAESVNLGIIELDAKGGFTGFFGAIEVQYSAFEYFLKMIATDEQKAAMAVTVPTEYSSLDIDSRGFVFATVSVFDSSNFREDIFIRKLNPLGNDILQRDGYTAPMGDVKYDIDKETGSKLTSQFVDVKADTSGIYTALDARYGRVFTYNRQGYLMYVFGGLGNSLGQFKKPVAVECSENDYFVLDQYAGWIVQFRTTEYGTLVKEATVAYDAREYDTADECWKEALKYTGKSQVAYNQVGRALMKNGEYEAAADYFRISENREGYSSCYQRIRAAWIDRWFSVCMILVCALIAVFVLAKRMTRRRKRARAAGKEENDGNG